MRTGDDFQTDFHTEKKLDQQHSSGQHKDANKRPRKGGRGCSFQIQTYVFSRGTRSNFGGGRTSVCAEFIIFGVSCLRCGVYVLVEDDIPHYTVDAHICTKGCTAPRLLLQLHHSHDYALRCIASVYHTHGTSSPLSFAEF